jgi:hypothetical protein
MRSAFLMLCLLMVWGCVQRPAPSTSRPTPPVPVAATQPQWPLVGHPISEWPAAIKLDHTQIMAQSAQMWPEWKLTCDDVLFTLGVDDGGIIRFVRTRSPKVITPDGIRVGDTYSSVMQKTGKSVILEPGWAWYVELPSGWYAVIAAPSIDPKDVVSPPSDSPVVAVFQRIGYGPVH